MVPVSIKVECFLTVALHGLLETPGLVKKRVE